MSTDYITGKKIVTTSHRIDTRLYDDALFLGDIDIRARLTDEEFERLAKKIRTA